MTAPLLHKGLADVLCSAAALASAAGPVRRARADPQWSGTPSPPGRTGGSSADTSGCTLRPPTSSTAAPPRACAHRGNNDPRWPWCARRTDRRARPRPAVTVPPASARGGGAGRVHGPMTPVTCQTPPGPDGGAVAKLLMAEVPAPIVVGGTRSRNGKRARPRAWTGRPPADNPLGSGASGRL